MHSDLLYIFISASFGYLQTFISPDGYGGSNLEHSAADGTTAIQLMFYNLINMYVVYLYTI